MRTNPDVHPPVPTSPIGGEVADLDYPVTDELVVREYLRIIYRRRWMILSIVAVGMALAAMRNFISTPIYYAQATLQFDIDMDIIGFDRPLLPLDQRDWMREFFPTQIAIVESHDVAVRAHEDLSLSASGKAAGSEGPVGVARTTTPLPANSGQQAVPSVGDIMAGRTAAQVKDTRLLTVGFFTPDPQSAAQVANALARAYLKQIDELKVRARGEASDWLTSQVELQRKLVEDSEAALQRYRQQRGADALFTNKTGVEQQNIVVQKLAELQGAVTKARTDTIEKEALYRQVSSAQGNREVLDTVPTIANNPYILQLKLELSELQRQLAQSSKELGDRHPDILKLQSAIQTTEGKIRSEISNAAAAIAKDLEAAQSRERALTGALERQKLEAQALNGKAVEYTALEREANTNREVLDKLLQRSREIALSRQLESTAVRVLDWAAVPDTPVLPRRMRTYGLGLVGSGAFAIVLVFGLEIFNTRVRTPEDVRRHLRIPVLGVVPHVKPQNGQTSVFLGDGAPAQFAELIHAFRTNLLMAPELVEGRTLLVTSAEPGEGKTVAVANIGVSLARLKQRVLLIDADLRKPRLHELFGEDQQPGLANVLTGTTSSRDVRKTRVPGLSLMSAGRLSHNPADLLGSERFEKLIAYLRQHFDWIIIDSPPALAVTDAALISQVASGVLVVIDCSRTSREVASAAVERLEAVRAPLVGAMLNRVVFDDDEDSYLPYYHREGGTYYREQDDNFSLPEVPGTAIRTQTGADANSDSRRGL
jgi:capsular exopolysaccharide synthesis family protein